VCEDLGGTFNGSMMSAVQYAQGLVHDLNSSERVVGNPDVRERRQVCKTSSFQSAVASVHFYPFVVMVERTGAAVPELIFSMQGTDWLSANDQATGWIFPGGNYPICVTDPRLHSQKKQMLFSTAEQQRLVDWWAQSCDLTDRRSSL
jgi:hypothetical protein